MAETFKKYNIVSPSHLRIKGLEPQDVRSVHDILQAEGCPKRENCFAAGEMGICLDDIQTRNARRNHTDKRASADILVLDSQNRVILTDLKYRCRNIRNLSVQEIKYKSQESKALLQEHTNFDFNFYLLFSSQVLTQSKLSVIRRKFDNHIQVQPLTTEDFYHLFAHDIK